MTYSSCVARILAAKNTRRKIYSFYKIVKLWKLYHFEKKPRQIGRGTAFAIFWHIKYLTGAVPLQRIYLSQHFQGNKGERI